MNTRETKKLPVVRDMDRTPILKEVSEFDEPYEIEEEPTSIKSARPKTTSQKSGSMWDKIADKKIQILISIGICLLVVFVLHYLTVISRTEWDGDRYYKTGQMQKGITEVDGETYYFDLETGLKKTGLIKDENGTYYFDESGHQKKDYWYQEGTTQYRYFDEEGNMVKGEIITLNGTRLKFGDNGLQMYYVVDGQLPILGENKEGVFITGWRKIPNQLKFSIDGEGDYADYYFDPNTYKALTGFHRVEDNDYYFESDGILAKNLFDVITENEETEEEITNVYYSHPDTGILLKGLQKYNDDLYYFSEDYKAQKGFITASGNLYYGDIDYKLKKGFFTVNGDSYYADKDAVLQRGLRTIADKTYHFDDKGRMSHGLVTYKDNTHYFNDKGHMETGLIHGINGEIYYASATGVLQKGLLGLDVKNKENEETTKKYYYFGDKWQAEKGLIKIKDKAYIFGEDKIMQTGLITLGGNKYYANSEGELLTGHILVDDASKYFKDDYVMATGLTKIGEDLHYFNKDGVLQKGLVAGSNGETYYADKFGVLQYGFLKLDGKTVYINKDNIMLKGLQTIGKDTYYFDKSGAMQTGLQDVQGNTYYFGNNGIMQTGLITINNQRYYFNDSLVKGTKFALGGKQYNSDANGVVTEIIEGVYTENNHKYYRTLQGTNFVGLKTISGKLYYFGPALARDVIVTNSGKSYFANSEGVLTLLQPGKIQVIDGVVINSKDDKSHIYKPSKNFVVIDLTNQQAIGYQAGKPIVTSNIISGRSVTPTLPGHYKVQGKESNKVLQGIDSTGKEYTFTVKHWLTFNEGLGIHDAPWQAPDSFTNKETYKTAGTNGSIYVPVTEMAKLQAILNNGDSVLVLR